MDDQSGILEPDSSYKLISTHEEALELFDEMSSGDHNILAFDMESDDIGNVERGKVCLIQMKLKDGPAYILDIHGSNIDLKTTKFNEIMKSTNVEKVIHDPRNDSKMLCGKYKTEMQRVFDPQCFHMTVESKSDGELSTRRVQSKRKSLDYVYEEYVKKEFPNKKLKKDMKAKMKDRSQNATLWLTRPLTREMATYAVNDVITLIPIHTYMKRYLQLKDDHDRKEFEKTFNELCLESIHPHNHKLRQKINDSRRRREFEEVKILSKKGVKLSKEEKKILHPQLLSPSPHRRRQSSIKSKDLISKQRKKGSAGGVTITVQGATCSEMTLDTDPDKEQGEINSDESMSVTTDHIPGRDNLRSSIRHSPSQTHRLSPRHSSPQRSSPTRVITSHLQQMKLRDQAHKE